jgi:hypothetical protein
MRRAGRQGRHSCMAEEDTLLGYWEGFQSFCFTVEGIHQAFSTLSLDVS